MSSFVSMFRRLFHIATEPHHPKPAKNNADGIRKAEQGSVTISNDFAVMSEAEDAALAKAIEISLSEHNTTANEKQAQAHAYFTDSSGKDDRNPQLAKSDFLTKRQIQALESGDAKSIEEANEEALAMAKRISTEKIEPASARMRSETDPDRIPPEERRGQDAVNENLRNWFQARDFQVVPNSGDSNNCLLISLLQHATKNYDSNHQDEATYYKAWLSSQSNGHIRRSDALFEDTVLIASLIDEINKDHNTDIQVEFYAGNSSDDPGVLVRGTGKTPVIIFNQAGHFEAVIPG